jgi:hypothetical protein
MDKAERTKRRLMKTSTFDALAMSEEKPVEEWDEAVLTAVLDDTAEVEKRRWIERASWIVLAMVTAGFGYVGGNYIHEEMKPEPWTCVITLVGEKAEDPDVLRCTGGSGQVIE